MAKKKTTKKASKKTEVKVDLKGEQTNNIKEGLGDVVEKITEKTGIKKVVKAVAGDDCGCSERKAALNKLFKFKVECLDKYEYEILDEFYSKNPQVIKPSEWRRLAVIGRRIFNQTISNDMGCGGCVRELVKKLQRVYETYEEKE